MLGKPEPVFIDDSGSYPDLRDVKGQETAKRAIEIAAAGGHNQRAAALAEIDHGVGRLAGLAPGARSNAPPDRRELFAQPRAQTFTRLPIGFGRGLVPPRLSGAQAHARPKRKSEIRHVGSRLSSRHFGWRHADRRGRRYSHRRRPARPPPGRAANVLQDLFSRGFRTHGFSSHLRSFVTAMRPKPSSNQYPNSVS